MGQLYTRMESDLTLKGLSDATRREYLRNARQFVAHFMRSPAEMGEAEARQYLHHLLDRGASVSTRKMATAAIKFLYVRTLGRPQEVATIPWPKAPETLPEIFSRDELRALFAQADSALLRAAFLTSYGSGARLSETCTLRPGDIDSARGVIHIHLGKGKKDRLTLLSPKLLAELREWWKARPRVDSPYLFPGQTSDAHVSRRHLQDGFGRAVRHAGVTRSVTFHSIRHSFATHMLEAGVDIRIIQAMLGHKNIKTTTRYAQVRAEHFAHLPDPLALLEPR